MEAVHKVGALLQEARDAATPLATFKAEDKARPVLAP